MPSAAHLDQLSEEQRRGERLRLSGELAAGLAHDLNNVLSIALGRLDVLAELERQQAPLPEPMRESLAVLRTALADASQTVRRLQRFASGQTAAGFRPVRMDEVARDAVELARPRWEREAIARGRTIRIEQHFNAPGLVSGDAAELREAILNLILNAVDALPDGAIAVGVDQTADGVVLSVADNGSGMAPDVLSSAWEPFFTTKGELGTGLGLSVGLRVEEQAQCLT